MMLKVFLALVFSMVTVPVLAQQPSHSSGFPVFRQFNLISINGAAYSDRLRTLNVDLAGNGNAYAVGFAGCHGWGGQIQTLDRDQIKVDLASVTQGQPQGPCTPAQQKAEDDFLSALKQVSRWRVEQQTLTLSWDNGNMRLAIPSQADICENKFNTYSINGTIDACSALIQSGLWPGRPFELAFFKRADMYKAKRDYEHAISDYDRAIQLNANYDEAFAHRGVTYEIKKQYDRAIADYDQAIRLNPDGAAYFAWRCRARTLSGGEKAAALTDCNESLRLRPDDPNAFDIRGLTYLRLGRFDNAIADYDAELKLNARKASAFYGRGLAKRAKGDSAGAATDIAAAKAIDADIAGVFGQTERPFILPPTIVGPDQRPPPPTFGPPPIGVGPQQSPQRSPIAAVPAPGIPAGNTATIMIGGKPRSYVIERPAISGPRPTIFILHGAGGDIRELRGLPQLAAGVGAVSVIPNGVGGRWNFFPPGKESQTDRAFFQQQYGGLPDDVGFLKGIAADLVARGIADPRRIFVAGLSLGGVMALRLACTDAETFAAMALLIAGMEESTGAECRPAKPLPVFMIRGTADQTIPDAGGLTVRGDRVWSTEQLTGFFRRLNGCTEPPLRSVAAQSPQQIETETSSVCTGGSVVLYRVVGGGHEVPPVLNAGSLVLDFFRAQTTITQR
jgi:poly(3-hydroxybutyrate) depolymerase/tetratricopeptide (TPR) repeat protein